MAYADISDVEVRIGRTLTAGEVDNVQALLDGASAVLNKLVKLDGGGEQAELLKMICTNMVSRLVGVNVDFLGASQQSITAGPYTQQMTFATPLGDMYLTKLEKRILGITSGYIGSVEASINGWYGVNDD